MAQFFDGIEPKIRTFIEDQKVFFVATAGDQGRVNLSPKGYDSLAVIGPTRVIWLNLSGSGNETAAHLLSQNRMTLMFCSFEGPPRILRLYGTAKTIHPRDESWLELLEQFETTEGARQIFDMQVESVQTSCGYGVPLFDFVAERDTLIKHAQKFSSDEQEARWAKNNLISIDGLPTGIFEDES